MSTFIPGYELGERLHFSPLISVFQAKRLADGREVVIKTLTSDYPANQDLAEIRHEFAIATRVNGAEGVVAYLGMERHGYGNLAIVMEPSGLSLAEVMADRERKPLPIELFLEIAIRTAKALSTIHQRDVVHKDVVPRNILLDEGTRRILFIDFGISSELSRERQDAQLANRLEGSLPYLSPEQTGRMNRDLDYRSDYYSLGITFYELITGRLPFYAEDTLEWIHSHMSKRPPPPREFNPRVPDAVAEVILKLIAKNAEDRYQSLFGLVADLEYCRDQWVKTGEIPSFTPGARDVSERFQVSQKLYGREDQVRQLAGLFENVASGEIKLCLVSGHSGIGKTALVNEINKPIVRERGFMIQGKYDQLQKNTSYSALGRALRGLIRQLLSESAEGLEHWRTSILEALGGNGQLIIEVIPDLEKLIGPQPPVQKLSGEEGQNRFQLVFIQFLKVFATEEHPLTIFLDDMQWSDAPTLGLLQRLFSSRDLGHLLMICAYRDNEVDVGHPFRLAVNEIEKAHSVIHLKLAPLDAVSVSHLVADTLRSDLATALPLAEEVLAKTEGNPFFVGELLKSLHEERAIVFDSGAGCWTWDMAKVMRTGLSSNVVDFVVSRLRKLPSRVQHLLELGSCIGNSFDLKTLCVISELSAGEVGRELIQALKSNILLPLDGSYRYFTEPDGSENQPSHINPVYKFQHDRVQQAAYALIDPQRKCAVHLSIGRLMVRHSDAAAVEERLIEIVSHLDEGRSLIFDAKERRELASLNLKAAVRARDSSAYEAALRYLNIGRGLLPEDSWVSDYELTVELCTEHARCAYLTGQHDEAEQCIDRILGNARTNLEKADLLSIRTRQYATTGRMEESIDAAIQGLSILGVPFTREPTRLNIVLETLKVRWNLRGRRIADVVEAPALDDPETLVAIRLLNEIFPPAFLSGTGNLLPYLVLKSVNISLRHGNCPEAAFAYAAYGMVLCGVLDDPALGYKYGKLAIAINDRLDDIRLKSRIIYVYAMFVHHWSNHWSTMTPWFKKGIEAGYQSGDMLYLAYSAQDCVIWDPKIDLETLCAEQRKYLTIVKDCDYRDSLDSGTLFLQLQANLMGLTAERYSLNDDQFDELACLEGMRQRKFMTGIANYHIYKADIAFTYEDYEQACHHVREQDKLIHSSMALPQLVRFNLIAFLTLAQLYPQMKPSDQRATYLRFKQTIRTMARWARNCRDNFLHLQRLMEAELARITNRMDDAVTCYTEAIALARRYEFRRDEALANEMFAKYYLSIRQDRAADGYLKAACRLYQTLGALRKVRHLEQSYPALLEQSVALRGPRDLSSSAARLVSESASLRQYAIDMSSVMKAARVISGEIVIDQLLRTVMEIMLENAGGQIGYFVMHQSDELKVVAKSGSADEPGESDSALPRVLADDDDSLPLSIIRYVLRTRENVVLDDASESHRFASDPYILRVRPKSVICIPITRQRDFEGAIYMENNLTVGAFTEARLEVMNMLAAQASISIENAQLYNNLEAKVTERTRELAGTLEDLKRTQTQLVHSEKMAGLGTLVAGVAHEINNPTNFVNLGATSLEEDLREFKGLLFGMLGDDNDPEITRHFEEKFQRFNAALGNINEGTVRISTIVRDLRTFSRLDEAEKKTVPLVENLESTLRLVRSQYQDAVNFITDFKANPEIECLPSQLNQVFMNVIVNACQAIVQGQTIDSATGPHGEERKLGTVTVSTRLQGGEVAIAIADTGSGMTEEVKQKIFEPFFTTKEVGEGTGMGMSICYQIVERHHGRFEIQSELGCGSTVTVLLPIK
ncbi:MAG: Serine/threonine-protein kinase PrkC [Nitrospira sp.]|nr:Serine/threonine-protein kinase PrkC [Nitrospira sp.]